MTEKIRLLALNSNNIGTLRNKLYKEGFLQIKESVELGFYLEAITIIESLISDRLESRLSYILGKDFSSKTLGALITKCKKEEVDMLLCNLVSEDLDAWRIERNSAIHEMVKISSVNASSWSERRASLKPTAEKGLRLLRQIDKRVGAIRKTAV